jgi:hypothetical protein
MSSVEDYMSSPLHAEIDLMAKVAGIPQSCVAKCACAGCGKKGIAADFQWLISKETWESDGPLCWECLQKREAE